MNLASSAIVMALHCPTIYDLHLLNPSFELLFLTNGFQGCLKLSDFQSSENDVLGSVLHRDR